MCVEEDRTELPKWYFELILSSAVESHSTLKVVEYFCDVMAAEFISFHNWGPVAFYEEYFSIGKMLRGDLDNSRLCASNVANRFKVFGDAR